MSSQNKYKTYNILYQQHFLGTVHVRQIMSNMLHMLRMHKFVIEIVKSFVRMEEPLLFSTQIA